MNFRVLSVVLSCLLMVLLPACSAPAPMGTPVERLNAALTAPAGERRAALTRLLADPGQTTTTMLASNLDALASVRFVDVTGDQAAVGWRASSADAEQWHLVNISEGCERTCRIALSPADQASAPLWLLMPVRLTTSEKTTLMGAELDRWEAAAAQAQRQLAATDLGGLGAGWDGRLTVVVPDTATTFEKVAWPNPVDVGAVTVRPVRGRPDGIGDLQASVILVNPRTTAGLDDDLRTLLIVHEAVHVATAEAGQPVPGRLWLQEGYAEAIALSAVPSAQAGSLVDADRFCSRQVELGDEQFSGPQANEAYAAAARWVAQIRDPTMIVQLWRDPAAIPPGGPCQ